MGHFGRLTDYAKQLADKGIISIFLLMEEGQIQLFFPVDKELLELIQFV